MSTPSFAELEVAAGAVIDILKTMPEFSNSRIAVIGGLGLWNYLRRYRTTEVRFHDFICLNILWIMFEIGCRFPHHCSRSAQSSQGQAACYAIESVPATGSTLFLQRSGRQVDSNWHHSWLAGKLGDQFSLQTKHILMVYSLPTFHPPRCQYRQLDQTPCLIFPSLIFSSSRSIVAVCDPRRPRSYVMQPMQGHWQKICVPEDLLISRLLKRVLFSRA